MAPAQAEPSLTGHGPTGSDQGGQGLATATINSPGQGKQCTSTRGSHQEQKKMEQDYSISPKPAQETG